MTLFSTLAINRRTKRPVVGGYDPDAQTYFTTYSITNELEKTWANQFVLDLKGGVGCLTPNKTDFWAKATGLGLYPGSPTSLFASTGNIRSPLTKDIVWIGSPPHSINGVQLNGTTQYGKLGIIPSSDTVANDLTLSAYIDADGGGTYHILSSNGTATQRTWLFENATRIAAEFYSATGFLNSVAMLAEGLITATIRSSTDLELWKGATSIATIGTSSGTPSPFELFFGAVNSSGTPTTFAPYQFRGAGVLPGITPNENVDWNDLWQRYQTNVIPGGRQV